jgi:hydroxymethylglutaryl-CoA lyase
LIGHWGQLLLFLLFLYDKTLRGVKADGQEVRNKESGKQMSDRKIEIIEVGVRDGLQNDPAEVSTEMKLEFVDRLLEAGVKRLEVASFVNPRAVPQMADSKEVMARVPRRKGISYIGLALNARGLEGALAAKCDEVNFVVSASDGFGIRNQNATTNETVVRFGEIAQEARRNKTFCSVIVTTAFGCPFDGEISESRLLDVVEALLEHRPDEIAIADTIGVADPWEVEKRLTNVQALLDKQGADVPLRLHVHNTRNTGIANVYAGVQAGVRIVDASCGGLGGCPFAPKATGNIATEDLVYMLERAGYQTGIDLDLLIKTSQWLEMVLDHPIPGLVAKAGGFPVSV